MKRSRYGEVTSFTTKDGSSIRELMHPSVHGNINQSFAEATVQPGQTTQLHRHRTSEEIYHVTAGEGVMTLAAETFPIAVGDTVLIPPGTPHCVENTGKGVLTILCACSPAYSHDDTDILT